MLKWSTQSFDESVSKVKSQYADYVEELEKIVAVLKTAAEELVYEAKRGEEFGVRTIIVRRYPFYKGPVVLRARAERNGPKVVIEVDYDKTKTKAELTIEERVAHLHNLAAIVTDDARYFGSGHLIHGAASYYQTAERLFMWAALMPGHYKITIKRVNITTRGLSPEIITESLFGGGGREKIERESPIHRLALGIADELQITSPVVILPKTKKGAGVRVLAASWLMISAILAAPEGGTPNDGLAALAGEIPRGARAKLRPYIEELDAVLAPISRIDKAYLIGKMVDYDGYIEGIRLAISAAKLKKLRAKINGSEFAMADVVKTAARAFCGEAKWRARSLILCPVKSVKELKSIPAFKAAAMTSRSKRSITIEKPTIDDLRSITKDLLPVSSSPAPEAAASRSRSRRSNKNEVIYKGGYVIVKRGEGGLEAEVVGNPYMAPAEVLVRAIKEVKENLDEIRPNDTIWFNGFEFRVGVTPDGRITVSAHGKKAIISTLQFIEYAEREGLKFE